MSVKPPPFLVLGLPRSRTAWLSRFLTYGDWVCGHEQIRHLRSLGDVRAWYSQPCIGSAETEAARWWRLLDKYAPNARIVVVRRPVDAVIDSLSRLGMGADAIAPAMRSLDAKLDQVQARMRNVLSVPFDDLRCEDACAAIFEHCLPYHHDSAHWGALAPVNIQIDMRALSRYVEAYLPALSRLAATARQTILTDMSARRPARMDNMEIQAESFDSWVRDAEALFDSHLVSVGEAPGDWRDKNLSLMRTMHDAGLMHITTARSNGRMFGYLATFITPSLTAEGKMCATNTAFFASPDAPGLGLKLQRASLAEMKKMGVDHVFWEASLRGDGPRIGALYKRLGAAEHGRTYRMQLAAA